MQLSATVMAQLGDARELIAVPWRVAGWPGAGPLDRFALHDGHLDFFGLGNSLHDGLRALPRRQAGERVRHALHRERARDADRLAGAKREPQVSALERRGADGRGERTDHPMNTSDPSRQAPDALPLVVQAVGGSSPLAHPS